ncbi:hypothetical protein HDU97_004535 [Phlyctochytrium planicorne]|nr:hypothetical protein HDU97_004535 [Phlyctochytrium planicorne]
MSLIPFGAVPPPDGYKTLPNYGHTSFSKLTFWDDRCKYVSLTDQTGCKVQDFKDAISICNDHDECPGITSTSAESW